MCALQYYKGVTTIKCLNLVHRKLLLGIFLHYLRDTFILTNEYASVGLVDVKSVVWTAFALGEG